MRPEQFPFGQPASAENKPSKDCGYRCLYYVLSPNCSYETWLENFRFFQPMRSGINFSDIATVLDFHKHDFRFTQLSDKGLFIIYSGIWLHAEGKKHGHYFCYQDGLILCSTHHEPYRMSLAEVVGRLEAKSIDHAFRCLQDLGFTVAS